jgi:hypothetical protein
MAKKKSEEVIEPIAEEVVEVEETKVDTADKTEEFIARKLKAINRMENPAKAKRLADRVLRKRGN